jgi:hypothetical protein
MGIQKLKLSLFFLLFLHVVRSLVGMNVELVTRSRRGKLLVVYTVLSNGARRVQKKMESILL